jgi:HIV Tat-specific factor 1
MLKGDGLVTYLKAPSVELACQILDGTPLRSTGPNMSVTPAKFEMKGQQYQDAKKAAGAAGQGQGKPKGKGGGGRGGGRGGSRGGRSGGGRGRKGGPGIQEKLERKLGWGGFDDLLPPEKVRV